MSEVIPCVHGRNFCLECHTTSAERCLQTKLDAALAREAALRKELAKVTEQLNWRGEMAASNCRQHDAQLVISQGLRQRLTDAEKRNSALEAALKFYADGDHLLLADADAWDTCSGEPINFLHDEAGTASVEDGSLAKAALNPVEPSFQELHGLTDAEYADFREWQKRKRAAAEQRN